jgi:F-type H+-transporting ATPase subunit delta
MQRFSADSLTHAEDRLSEVAASGHAERLGDELFAVVGVLSTQGSLRRALTDPSASGEAKAALVRSLFGSQVSEATLDVVAAATSGRWSAGRDLLDALEHLGVLAYVISAEPSGAVDDLEDDLFRFSRVVAGDPRLRDAITNKQAPIQLRQALVTQLLEGKASPAALHLAVQAVASREGSFEAALESYQKVAADRQHRVVAIVRTAVALTDAEQERLVAALRHLYSRDVYLNLVVDPGLLGGMRIELGDDIIDGTVVGRLNEARRRMTA